MDSVASRMGRPAKPKDGYAALREEHLRMAQTAAKLRAQIDLIVDNNSSDLAKPGLVNRQGQLEILAADYAALNAVTRSLESISRAIASGTAAPEPLADLEEVKAGLLA